MKNWKAPKINRPEPETENIWRGCCSREATVLITAGTSSIQYKHTLTLCDTHKDRVGYCQSVLTVHTLKDHIKQSDTK